MEDIIKIKREGYKLFIHKKERGTMIKYKLKFNPVIDDNGPLTFVRKDDNGISGISLTLMDGKSTTKVIQYSLDTVNWKTYSYGTVINLVLNLFVLFRSLDEEILPKNITFTQPLSYMHDYTVNEANVSKFNTTNDGIYECYGKVSSLYNDNTDTDGDLYALFSGTRITRAPILDLTNFRTQHKYCATFKNCSLLEEIPFEFIDITSTAGIGFYANMFYGCSSLKNHPSIKHSSTSITERLCAAMFYGCSSLEEIPLFDKVKSNTNTYCYAYMYGRCSKLTDVSNFWDGFDGTTLTGNSYCYVGTFFLCTSLKKISNKNRLTINSVSYSTFQYCFSGCSSLVNAPSFNIIYGISGSYSFYRCFSGCSSLVNAPDILSTGNTTLRDYCFNGMYNDCTNLISGGTISFGGGNNLQGLWSTVTISGSYVFLNMYYNCTNLISPPIFRTVFDKGGSYLFSQCFYNCTSLTKGPIIIFDDNSKLGYGNIFENCFYNCTSLTNAIGLPFGTLGNSGANNLYSYCSNLTNAPKLLLSKFNSSVYNYMFRNCSKLSKLYAYLLSWGRESYGYLQNVNPTGEFITNLTEDPSSRSESSLPSGWTRKHGTVDRYYWELEKGLTLNLGIYAKDVYDITLSACLALSGNNEFMYIYDDVTGYKLSLKSNNATSGSTKLKITSSFSQGGNVGSIDELFRNKPIRIKLNNYFKWTGLYVYNNLYVYNDSGTSLGELTSGMYSSGTLENRQLYFDNALIYLTIPDTTYPSYCSFYQIRTIHGVFIPHKDGRHLINYTTNELIDTGQLFEAVKYTNTVTNDKICGADFYKWMYEDDE